MIRIGICDDNKREIIKIRQGVETYFSEHRERSFEVKQFDNPTIFLEEMEKNIGGLDILLLDVCMPGVLGTEVAREIRAQGDTAEIIFLSTSTEFAVEAFAVKATHYLTKPFTQTDFNEAIDRAMEKIEGKQKVEKIVILTESGILHHVIIGDILYVESFAHRQILHLEGGETITEVRRSLKRILDELEERAPKQFFIPYKGYVVNKRKIKVVEKKEIILSSDDTIPIPVRKFREIRDLFFDYVFSEEEEMKE